MPDVLVQPLTRWPGGSPRDAARALPDTSLAIIAQASGVDESFPGGVIALGVAADLGDIVTRPDVRVRTTGNIDLAAPGAAVDGVTMSVDDRFLADRQTTVTQDGVYLWQGAATPATRAADFAAGAHARLNLVNVTEGTSAGARLVCSNAASVDVAGTDGLTFVQLSDLLTPNFATQVEGHDWWGLASDDGSYQRGTQNGNPRLVVLTLADVPQGLDVFVCSGEYGYAELAPGGTLVRDPGGALRVQPPQTGAHGRRMSGWAPVRTGAAMAASTIAAPDGTALPVTANSSLLSFGDTPPRASTLRLLSVTASGVPWFLSDDPLDAGIGPFPGSAFAAVSSRVDDRGQYLPGLWAVVNGSGLSAPWIVMRLRPE